MRPPLPPSRRVPPLPWPFRLPSTYSSPMAPTTPSVLDRFLIACWTSPSLAWSPAVAGAWRPNASNAEASPVMPTVRARLISCDPLYGNFEGDHIYRPAHIGRRSADHI